MTGNRIHKTNIENHFRLNNPNNIFPAITLIITILIARFKLN